jgi:hypothetical protein
MRSVTATASAGFRLQDGPIGQAAGVAPKESPETSSDGHRSPRGCKADSYARKTGEAMASARGLQGRAHLSGERRRPWGVRQMLEHARVGLGLASRRSLAILWSCERPCESTVSRVTGRSTCAMRADGPEIHQELQRTAHAGGGGNCLWNRINENELVAAGSCQAPALRVEGRLSSDRPWRS